MGIDKVLINDLTWSLPNTIFNTAFNDLPNLLCISFEVVRYSDEGFHGYVQDSILNIVLRSI